MGHHRRPQRLGHRRQLEDGVRVNLVAGSHILDAEPLGVYRLSAVHHGHRHTRDARFLHQLVGHVVELGNRVVHGVGRQIHRRHQRRRNVRQGRLGGRRGLPRRSRVTTPYHRPQHGQHNGHRTELLRASAHQSQHPNPSQPPPSMERTSCGRIDTLPGRAPFQIGRIRRRSDIQCENPPRRRRSVKTCGIGPTGG
jgi:hypothetical protein